MIKQAYKATLNERLDSLLRKHGVPVGVIHVTDIVDYLGKVTAPKDFANEHSAALTEVFDEFWRGFKGLDQFDHVDYGEDGRTYRGNEERRFEFAVKSGLWERTAQDEAFDEEEDRAANDVEYAEELAQKERDAKRPFYQEYLIPIPRQSEGASTETFLVMAYKYYDAIKDGYIDEETGEFRKKDVEYRRYTESYVKKLLSHPIKSVKFQRGYGGPGRAEPEQMRYEVKRIFLAEKDVSVTTDPFNVKVGFIPEWIGIELGERIS